MGSGSFVVQRQVGHYRDRHVETDAEEARWHGLAKTFFYVETTAMSRDRAHTVATKPPTTVLPTGILVQCPRVAQGSGETPDP